MRSTLLTTFAAALAAMPQCGSPPVSVSEPTAPAPVSEASSASEPPASDQAGGSEPEAVVSALLAAMDANDAGQIRALFDANASQAYGDGPAQSGEAFFRWLDSDIIQRQGRVESAQLTVNGNEVVVTGQYQSRGYTSAANFLLNVEDGRIVSWQMRY